MRTPLTRLEAQVDRLAGLLDEEPDPTSLRAEHISAWSVGEQVDHMLKVLDSALGRVAEPGDPVAGRINLVGRTLLAVGRLPRGVGKSPAKLRAERRERAELQATLAAVRARMRELGGHAGALAESRPILRHPYFGCLTARQAVRFLEVHTDHHLRIVADIRRAASP